jgi:DNA repair exonuclease SbcCD ATPase subunit
MIDLSQEARLVSGIASRLHLLSETVQREQKELTTAVKRLEDCQTAQEVLQHLAQAVQQMAHGKIAEVVSSCLSAVFEDPYEFIIEFERKRGRTEAHLKFKRNELEMDPLNSSGGGAVDIAAFALRVASLMLHRPRLSKVIVLDEPMKFVSAEYQTAVRQMLEGLAKDMGLQIVMVTHNETYCCGKIIEL